MRSVYVGMSGGVDSSVTAALLQDQGYAVSGVYMKNWTADLPGVVCPWKDDLADAKRVAVQLGIPFKVFDFQNEYRQKVVDYMIAEYRAGRTPNPDIMCNQEVKFKLFLNAALSDGADMIATGHYARILRRGTPPSTVLAAGLDAAKDQSYFLYRVSAAALTRTLMPLGALQKSEVREIAARKGLATAAKKDSQGICFVGQVGMKDFLSQYIPARRGEIVERAGGRVVGEHAGAAFYTIGQRHGLGVGGGEPFYVSGKDMEKNIVFVTKARDGNVLQSDRLILESLHWIHEGPAAGDRVQVRSRYRSKLLWALITETDTGRMVLQLEEPERAVAAGQSSVVYREDEVLGGGVIV